MRTLRSFRAYLALLSAPAALGWGAPPRAELAPASPFLPLGSAAGAAGQSGPAGPVELRGIMSTSEGTAYCIYDTAKKTSAWVRLNEGGKDFVVRSADPASDSVTVEFQGRSLRLVLRTAKIASAGPGAQFGAPAGPPLGAVPPVVLNPSPADEQRRLDAVAQEVRRRRLERERASQAAQAGGQAPFPLPPPQPNR